MPKVGERFRNGWNAFMGRDPTKNRPPYYIDGSSIRPDRITLSRTSARSILNSIYNRIAIDVSEMEVRHVRVDKDDNYVETINSDLNSALTMQANLDQTGRSLIQDITMSMFDEGCIGVIPVDTDIDPEDSTGFRIYTLRTGKILEWFPTEVRLEAYDERIGRKREIVCPKSEIAIIENPFYSIMNEPNSTLQRLLRVLSQLDKSNDEVSAGKMDLIIQLPYTTKAKARQIQAEERRRSLEEQLTGSQYGVGYIDGTEKVIQLNRSVENNLWSQAKDLSFELYNQLGLTQSIFDGTADEKTLLNYYDRTVNPALHAITEAMQIKWLSKTARSQGQRIRYFRNPFKLVPVGQLAELADKFTRNEVMTSNEIRSVIGLKPADDPNADKLLNSNLNHPDENQNKEDSKVNIDITDISEKKV